MKPDVLIVGGGCAGLMAARELATAGKSVTLVEARPRLGGRILTVFEDGIPIELGAEFVHGKPPVLMSLLEESRLPYFERGGKTYGFEHGRLVHDENPEGGAHDDGGPFAALKDLPATPEHDVSFADAARKIGIPWLTRYVEGFNAADATRISAASLAVQQRAEDSISGDTSFRLSRGYKSLVDWLESECRERGVQVQLDLPVRSILWQPGEAVAICDSTEFHAAACIVTLPLGVLKAGTVMFQPEPEHIFSALSALEMGHATRIALLFKRRFWEHLAPDMNFLIDSESAADINVWWTLHPDSAPLLTGWIGGPRAMDFRGPEELLSAALRSLSRYFEKSGPELRKLLLSSHTHDWQRDPFSRGAYSCIAVGGLPKLAQLAQPVEQTLFFAGEHTEQDGHWGTVHAALETGLRAAQQVLDR